MKYDSFITKVDGRENPVIFHSLFVSAAIPETTKTVQGVMEGWGKKVRVNSVDHKNFFKKVKPAAINTIQYSSFFTVISDVSI